MVYQYIGYTHTGSRDSNDDSFEMTLENGTLLAVVADGLGGHKNGSLASRMVVNSITHELKDAELDEDLLAYAIIHANKSLCDANINGMTTVAALWICADGNAVAAHVGDSRIYQIRDGEIIFQSQDHSMVQLAVLVGEITPEEARHHKDRNKVFRVLGEKSEDPKVDSTELTVEPGDRFLLCSDGFWEPITEEMMVRTAVQSGSASDWLNAMQQLIFAAGNSRQDNHTAVCIIAEYSQLSTSPC